MTDLAARIWRWLPARADSRRVTLPGIIATSLGADLRDVGQTLARLEAAGHVVRDRAIGRQSGWHRGTPLPTEQPTQPETLPLF